MIDRVNAFLGRFVGPNAAHVIDGLIGVAIVGGVAIAESPASRAFLAHHSTDAMLVAAGVPLATGLASKFRKAAGSSNTIADAVAAAVKQALAETPVTIDAKTIGAAVAKEIAKS